MKVETLRRLFAAQNQEETSNEIPRSSRSVRYWVTAGYLATGFLLAVFY